MKDISLYEGSNVLKTLLNIKKQTELDEAEADYVSFRLLTPTSFRGDYIAVHFEHNHAFGMGSDDELQYSVSVIHRKRNACDLYYDRIGS